VKQLTREQIQSRKDKAAGFTGDVLGDPDRAAEIENESLESYADRRGFQITNPRGGRCGMRTKDDLLDRIEQLEEENENLQQQLDDIADIVAPDEDGNGGNGNGDDDEEE
jgi:hypothetical protein